MKYKYKLEGLDCANCATKVEEALNNNKSINEASLNFATGNLSLESDDENIDEIVNKIVTSLEPDVKVNPNNIHQPDSDHHHHHSHDHNHECSCHEHHHEIDENRSIDNGMNFHIANLDCANCAMKVEEAIKNDDIIDDAIINFGSEKLMVKTKKDISYDLLLKRLQNIANSVEDGVVISYEGSKITIEKPKLFDFKKNIDLVVGTILYILAILLEKTTNTPEMITTIIFIGSYLLIGYKVILKALRNIKRKDIFDENFLMCVATFGALYLRDFAEAIAVMLFYSIGEIFQSYAVNKTRSSISSLMDIKSDHVNVLENDQIIIKKPEEVKIGDIMVVKVGEKVPLDGIVVQGDSSLDTSSLTGEPLPRDIHQNDEILSGVVNLGSVINVKVNKEYADSTVSKIIDLMENSSSKKAHIEQFVTRFARVYTPLVVFMALCLLIVPMILQMGISFSTLLNQACTFLVVSCPCALVISIPLGLYAGIGKASKLGALIKGGNYLEIIKDLDTVVFDKTGTLTKGEFKVIGIEGDDNLLEIGAYGEFLSNHPIAKSIVNKYDQDIDQTRIKNFKETSGKGIEVDIDDKHVLLGNEKLLNEHNIEVNNPSEIGSVVFIAIDNKFAGSIVVGDIIKDNTISGLAMLKKAGIKNKVMLTGDHSTIANNIAKKIGIDNVYSDLLPQDKVTKLESLMNDDNCVAFVGDGINDAPVLARADIGISMGGVGSDVAIEASDVVLMQDNIETISKVVDLSKYVNFILRENVVFALGVKALVLILTPLGYTNMWMGVFADVGVTLIAILNSMRILK